MNAALAAGMQVVLVPERNVVDPDYTRPATLAIRTLTSFVPEEFGLPGFCECIQPKSEESISEQTSKSNSVSKTSQNHSFKIIET